MDINKYTGFFHDGSIIDVRQAGDKVEFFLESSQLRPEWNKDNIPLSDYQTIKGKLHLDGVKNILAGHQPANHLKMRYDHGEILDLDICNNKKMELLVIWINFPPKKRAHDTELIEIEAEKIYWENIPDLFDPMMPLEE